MKDNLDEAAARSSLRRPTTLRFTSATRAECEGRELVVFCGNDYLGLRFDGALTRAVNIGVETYGVGAGASRLVSGDCPAHTRAEAELASFVGLPTALLVGSGYAANVGTLPALAGSDDVIISDRLNHASIVDGCRLARARTLIYEHGEVESLERTIRTAGTFRRGFVVTESVFSMDGDLAPLAELASVALRAGLHLYVDEAHALGVVGPDGRGACAAAKVVPDVLVGTLGKAFGLSGAFVAGSDDLRLYLWNHLRSFVFSTGMAPAIAWAAAEATGLVAASRARREQLARNLRRVREGIRRLGFDLRGNEVAPIVPIVAGDDARAVRWCEHLKADGIFVQAIRPPTVPRGTARLRVTVSAAHTEAEIDQLLAALSKLQ